VVKVKFMQSNA